MTQRLRQRVAVAGVLAFISSPVGAHSFGQTYALPVPVWMYIFGAAAALLLSFLLVGYFVTARAIDPDKRGDEPPTTWTLRSPLGRWLIGILRWLSAGALALTIVAGFFGTQDSYRNINMTLFWVMFYLGFTYFTAVAGDLFSILNPFRFLVEAIERFAPGLFKGRVQYPASASYWSSLALYIAFIWIELFGRSNPFSLAAMLSAYTAINFFGCWLVGKTAWFERCEFLGVFLRLVSRIAPIAVNYRDQRTISSLNFRPPFVALLQGEKIPVSLLLFILFMLSSTAFDGLKETALWVGVFFKNLYQLVLIPLYGDASHIGYPTIKKLFLAYQTSALVISPLLYFFVYALFILLAKFITRSKVSFSSMLLSFGYCLIPIAFVYNVTHYYTLLQIQGPEMLRLLSDPLGKDWNLFGTAGTPMNIVPNLAVVWHAQVFLIIAGHVVSVYLAHLQALKLFSDRRTAILSQLPMLLLMVGFTAFGLWILSLPLNSSPVRLAALT